MREIPEKVAAKQVSKDGTKKLAYRLSDGQVIESVLMPYSDGRRTACISSQAGCAMGCVFCATGQVREKAAGGVSWGGGGGGGLDRGIGDGDGGCLLATATAVGGGREERRVAKNWLEVAFAEQHHLRTSQIA